MGPIRPTHTTHGTTNEPTNRPKATYERSAFPAPFVATPANSGGDETDGSDVGFFIGTLADFLAVDLADFFVLLARRNLYVPSSTFSTNRPFTSRRRLFRTHEFAVALALLDQSLVASSVNVMPFGLRDA